MRELKITQSITTRDESLNRYLAEISKIPMLTTDEEVSLAAKIRQGDEEALEKLVNGNLRFVVSVAKQYQCKGISLMDLINEGNIGLIKAAREFDETRGFKFISYAVWWIRQSIISAMNEESSMIRIPQNVHGNISKVKKAAQRFEQEHQFAPTAQDLEEIIELPVSKIKDALGYTSFHVSIDAPTSEDDDRSFLDTFESDAPSADSGLIAESLHEELTNVISQLTCREQRVICMFYGINSPQKSLEEISDEMGLSRERVRQIRSNSIIKMQSRDNINRLRAYA